MTPVVRLIVPRRRDGGHRDRVWDFCKRYWTATRPKWRIVEGDHDEGPFNRAAAINRAARGRWDVAVILDADTLLDAEAIDSAIEQTLDTKAVSLPFSHRLLLSARGTERVLAGEEHWDRWVESVQRPNDRYRYISGSLVVPRCLWDAVGGFDERFCGWGGEDDAFFAACTVLSGHDARTSRIPGKAWHLWHQTSPWMDRNSALYRMARALAERYLRADVKQMLELLEEPRTPEQVVLVCLTTGKRATLDKTLASTEAKLHGPIGRRLLLVDAERTRLSPKGWDVEPLGASRGYSAAMARATQRAIGSGQPWIFWLEDDFTFNRKVDLERMQATMDAYPDLAQLVLLRQPWYEPEIAAGSVLADPRYTFAQRDGHVVHRAYWSMNPMLTRREVLARHEWPQMPGSEARFARRIFTDETAKVAYWGKRSGKPWVHHIGHEPAGSRY